MSRRRFWLAGLYYLLASVVVTMWLWRDPASRIVTVNPYDTDQFAWFFRYDATAVAHLHLPALTSTGMNAPQGFNVMWNTPMLLPGTVLAPLTLLAGPQVSLTVLMTVGFAGSALAMFTVLGRWGASVPAAAIGGLVYGFSPALIGSAYGHYDLQFAVLPPLIVDAVLRLFTDGAEGGRRAALRRGAWLGVLVAAQLFITEEQVFDSAVMALILLVVLAVSRPRAVRGRIGGVLPGAAAAAAVIAVIAGYPLWEQYFGPIRQYGSPFTPDYYKNDLAGFVQPSASMLIHTHSSAAFAAAFQGQLPEYLAYLGWPMLLALAAIAVLFWRLLAVRAAAVAFFVLDTLSLGGTLLAGGHEHSWLKLPWYLVQTTPLVGAAIPDRFSILADCAAAALFAFGLDAAVARWPAIRLPVPGREPSLAHETGAGRRGLAARLAFGGAVLAAIAPLVPRPLPVGLAAAVPAGWTATFAALRLPADAPVLVVPIPMSGFTEPLRWQADTGVPSSLVGGYFMGPGGNGKAATDGTGTPAAGQFLNQFWSLSMQLRIPRGDTLDVGEDPRLRAELMTTKATAVVAVTSAQSSLGRYLTQVLGPPTTATADVLGWRLHSGSHRASQDALSRG